LSVLVLLASLLAVHRAGRRRGGDVRKRSCKHGLDEELYHGDEGRKDDSCGE
jgi:hypothetical protein